MTPRDILVAKAEAYEKQAAFYNARADVAAHTAIAANYFRREAAKIRRSLRSPKSVPLLSSINQ
jgi:hypothetical protein